MALSAVILAAIVFSGNIHGGWVYDDEHLIVRNAMVQDPRLVWDALTSDLFAQRSAAGEAGSPYWRPTTTLWFIINHRLFGLDGTLGWHLGNIALHALATLLAFLVMRRLGMGVLIAGAAAWVLAVHPTRTESVAWISGVPDLLLGVGFLGALLCVLGLIERRDGAPETHTKRAPKWLLWAGAILLYIVALGSKEVAIVFPAVAFVAALRWRPRDAEAPEQGVRPDGSSWLAAAKLAAPFAVLAGAYLLVRAPIVAGATDSAEGPGLAAVVRTLPLTGLFYVRQIVLPYWLGPSYPLRPVTAPDVFNVVLPLIALAAIGAGMLWLALGRAASRAALVGVVLFVLALAPAGLAASIAPELMVQDRYLYLPLMGFVMVFLAGAQRLLTPRIGPERPGAMLTVAVGALCLPLAVQSFRYAPAWAGNAQLWNWAVKNDPNSRFPWAQYGTALLREDKLDEAAAALDRANAIRRTVHSTLSRCEIGIRLGEYDESEAMLNALLAELRSREPLMEIFLAADQLGQIYIARDNDVDRAVNLLREVRAELPNMNARISDRIAVTLMLAGRRDEALAELEAARPHIAGDPSEQARWALYRLGQLYAERGRLDEAAAAFEEFVRLTAGTGTPSVQAARGLAQEALVVIRRGPQAPPPAQNPAVPPTSGPGE